jgi:hypothetical protein
LAYENREKKRKDQPCIFELPYSTKVEKHSKKLRAKNPTSAQHLVAVLENHAVP